MRKFAIASLAVLFSFLAIGQTVSFKLKTDYSSYVVGEEVKLSLRLVNMGITPVIINDYEVYKNNRIVIDIVNQDKVHLKPFRSDPIVTDLALDKDEGEVITINLSNWYPLDVARYQLRVFLFCNGLRYESEMIIFDVVPGIELATASHYTSLSPAVERTLRLVYWSRDGKELAFLRADDRPGGMCRTLQLGNIVRVKKPSIEKIKGKTSSFYIYRQVTRDVLSRTEITSDVNGIHVKDNKRAIESASSPMIDSLREAVEKKAGKKKK